jgi:hypothetical protein
MTVSPFFYKFHHQFERKWLLRGKTLYKRFNYTGKYAENQEENYGGPRGGCGEYSFLSRDFLDCGGGIGKNFRRRHICSCFPSAADMVS